MLQPRSRISEADAFAYRIQTRHARSVVFDTDYQLISLSMTGHSNRGVAIIGFPVLDRVLEQRLQKEHRHSHDQRAWFHVDFDGQLLSETHALDVEIVVEE